MAAKKTLAAKPARKSAIKQSAAKRSSTSKTGDEIVTVDRRRNERRDDTDTEEVAAASIERRQKVQRRRQIDPTTCERDYSIEEVEFMNAMDDYKRSSGRMFPTCSEVLEVIRGLGYVRLSPAGRVMMAEVDAPANANEESELELSSTF